MFALLAAFLTTAAIAAPPPARFPQQRAGMGSETTAGSGLFAGDLYRARSAVIRWNGHIGSLDLYLFRRRVAGCAGFERAATEPGKLLQIAVAREAVKLPVGTPVRRPLAEFITQRRTPPPDVVLVRPVVLVFTRVDTTKNALWHGRVTVKPRRVQGRVYSYAGTFAARWCVAPSG
jgi:hypothetical protein